MREKRKAFPGFSGGVFLCICALILIMSVPGAAREMDIKLTLSNADCEKCHEQEPQEIAVRGMAHRTEVTCQSCHRGHRPGKQNNIPACSECHAGMPHFEIAGCLNCHNPHAPMDISLKGELKEICLTCHETQGHELAENPSRHSDMACNFCHAERHAAVSQCTECHEPHSGEMSQADCGTCHQAHMPLALNWGAGTPSIHCAACHDTAYAQLRAGKTPHGEMECASCHGGKHKFIPGCSDCHGMPHAEGMHQKFPRCGDCHNTAHDLNNWSGKMESK